MGDNRNEKWTFWGSLPKLLRGKDQRRGQDEGRGTRGEGLRTLRRPEAPRPSEIPSSRGRKRSHPPNYDHGISRAQIMFFALPVTSALSIFALRHPPFPITQVQYLLLGGN